MQRGPSCQTLTDLKAYLVLGLGQGILGFEF
jgi:hypothetical protein